jgi:hypothetical protein
VFLFGAEQNDAPRVGGVGEMPVHLEFLRKGRKALGEFLGGEVERTRTNFNAHEETRQIMFRVLARFGNPPVVLGYKTRHLGDDS